MLFNSIYAKCKIVLSIQSLNSIELEKFKGEVLSLVLFLVPTAQISLKLSKYGIKLTFLKNFNFL